MPGDALSVHINIEHVSFIEISVGVRLLTPIVVANLFPDLSDFAADRYKPVLFATAKWDVFDRVPKVPAESCVAQQAPVFVFSQQPVATIRHRLLGECCHLGMCGESTSKR